MSWSLLVVICIAEAVKLRERWCVRRNVADE